MKIELPKFRKKENVDVPKIKKVSSRTASRFVVISFLVILGLALYGSIRAIGFSSNLSSLENNVSDLKTDLDNTKDEQQQLFDNYALNSYVQDFLTIYFHLTDKSEEQAKRSEQLKEYFAKNIELPSGEYQGINRTLLSFQLVSQSKKKDYYSLVYKVKYKLTGKQLKEKEVEKDGQKVKERTEENLDKDVINYITVDVHEEKGLYTVVSLPYFVSKVDKKGKFDGLVDKTEVTVVDDNSTVDSLKEFTELFMKKYASGTKEDLQYLMSEVEGLYGTFSFVRLDGFDVYKIDDNLYRIKTRVILKDSVLDYIHYENFYLTVSKKDNKFFVEKLEHLLGGNE